MMDDIRPWNLEQTRELVCARYGAEQLESIRPCMQSIVDRQAFATIHFLEQKRLLKEGIDDKLDGRHVLELMLPIIAGNGEEFYDLTKPVEAHVIACLQSLHCLGDTVAHVVYFACGLNKVGKPLQEDKVDLTRVEQALSSMPAYAAVHSALCEIRTHPDFLYLNALVNHCKHRSIIRPNIHVDMTGEAADPYALRFGAFKHKGVQYDSRDVKPFLEPFYSWMSFQIVKVGNAINDRLETIAH